MSKKPIANSSEAMRARGPEPGSSSHNVHHPIAGVKNLQLVVDRTGARSFLFDRTYQGQRYTMTLGKLGEISYEGAIEEALACHRFVDDGIDPKIHRAFNRKLTFKQFVDRYYRTYMQANFSSHKNMENMLQNRLLDKFGDKPLKEISKKQIREFLLDLSEEVNLKSKKRKKISGSTVNAHHSFLSGAFKFAMEMDLVQFNPCAGIKRAKLNPSRARYLRDDEYRRLFEVMRPLMHRKSVRAIFLLLVLGLRRGEILSLAWKDVDLKSKEIFIRKSKNGESRYVGLNSLALDMFKVMRRERKKKTEWVFPSNSKTGYLQEIGGMFDSLCRKADIKDVVTHDCRRSHATQLLRAGVDLATVKEVLGHKTIQTTLVYARVTSAAVAEANELAASKLKEVIGG